MVKSLGGKEGGVQQLHGQSGGLESASHNRELFHILRICAGVLISIFPGKCLYCPASEEFRVLGDALVSLSQFCSSPNCLLLPPALAHSPELPCQSLLSSLAVLFDCLFLSIAQSILPFLKDRKDYVH